MLANSLAATCCACIRRGCAGPALASRLLSTQGAAPEPSNLDPVPGSKPDGSLHSLILHLPDRGVEQRVAKAGWPAGKFWHIVGSHFVDKSHKFEKPEESTDDDNDADTELPEGQEDQPKIPKRTYSVQVYGVKFFGDRPETGRVRRIRGVHQKCWRVVGEDSGHSAASVNGVDSRTSETASVVSDEMASSTAASVPS